MTTRLLFNDCKAAMRLLIAEGVRVHGVCSDPPYGLTSVTKRFGKPGSAPAKAGSDGRFARQSAGFMNERWDGTGIENDPEMWRLCYELLLPGGYLVAFSSSRTFDMMTGAIREAGFIIHPMITWVQSQGFPKAHDAARAIDLHLGKEGSPEALAWQGWAYGTQARKPVLEPICVAQRPFSEKNGAANILKWGVGAVNIDGCRIETDENLNGGAYAKAGSERQDAWGKSNGYRRNQGLEYTQPTGRWPGNLIHDGSPEVMALFPESAGQLARSSSSSEGRKTQHVYGDMRRGTDNPMEPRNDSGSAARFFECYPFEGAPLFYHAKAKAGDRVMRCSACGERFLGRPSCECTLPDGRKAPATSHPTVKPPGLLRSLVRHIVPAGGTVLDPFAGSGTMGEAARLEGINSILIEKEPQYVADIMARMGAEVDPPPLGKLLLQALGLHEEVDDWI